MNFEEFLDEPVTLYGVAQNSTFGAILQCGPNSVVYVEGVSEWEAADESKMIELSGTLVAAGDDADLHGDDGTVKHGIGRHYVVREATWERLS
ncbi:hypothetical protein [Nocardia blacklockiae]|uniref:hypothetical protein n=1 Tax=Nocardia blacklockiae TaxID=480036 RepID=UPI001895787D|nr:hypothetical protein [Nocardia blacklockiae]MBF6174209.1 hypothetical protein [Nocardia blacklockiae]